MWALSASLPHRKKRQLHDKNPCCPPTPQKCCSKNSFSFSSVNSSLVLKPGKKTNKKKLAFVLSHTKPNKQRQGLNLYGPFIHMAGDLRRWVHTLTTVLNSILKWPFL